MEIDIRKYIISNFKGDSKSEIKKSINASIKDNDEETLPGLGVLFELLWKSSDKSLKNNILDILENSLS